MVLHFHTAKHYNKCLWWRYRISWKFLHIVFPLYCKYTINLSRLQLLCVCTIQTNVNSVIKFSILVRFTVTIWMWPAKIYVFHVAQFHTEYFYVINIFWCFISMQVIPLFNDFFYGCTFCCSKFSEPYIILP